MGWILFVTRWSSVVEQWVPDAQQVSVSCVAVERPLSLLSDTDRFTYPSSLPVTFSSNHFGIVPVNDVVRLRCMVRECRLMESVLGDFTLRSSVVGLRRLLNILFMFLDSDTQLSPSFTDI